MFTAAILVPSRAATLAAHLFASVLLVMVGIIEWQAAHWFGAVDNLIFGAGSALAGLIYRPGPDAPKARYNLVTLLLGVISVATGLLLLLFQNFIQPGVSPEVRDYLPVFGALFIAGAWLLFFVMFPLHNAAAPGKRWPGITWLAYLACGLIWLVFLVWVIYPSGSWTDMAFFTVVVAYLLIYPWLVTYSSFPFRTSLHARITLILGIAVAFPLVITVSWISRSGVQNAEERTLSYLGSESSTRANSISYFVNLYRTDVLSLAHMPSILDPEKTELAVDLTAYEMTSPNLLALTVYDQNGQSYAKAINSQLFPAGADPAYEQVKRSSRPFFDVIAPPIGQKPVLAFGVPISDENGNILRILTCYYAADQMEKILTSKDASDVTPEYLVDDAGRAILQPSSVMLFKDLAGYPQLASTLAARSPSGTLKLAEGDATLLIGYTQVPGWGWYVLSTQKENDALAELYYDRIVAFGLLVICLFVALLGGWWIAGKLTDSLATLSRAAVALANGDPYMPLPKSRIQELANLAHAFGSMRDRLVARTLERARAEGELRQSKEVLEDRVNERTAELQAELQERQRIEEELRETRNRFQLVLDHSPIMVFTTDQDLRYTWVYNPWSGFLPRDLLHHRDDDILPQDSISEMLSLKQSVRSSGQAARREVTLHTGDGDFTYDMIVQPLYNNDGQVNGVCGAAMDITEQKHMQSEMRHSAAHIEVQRRLIQLREQERVQIARDLHDGPLQDLIGLNFMISSAIHLAGDGPLNEPLKGIYQSMQEQIEALRAFAGELRPPALAKFGLSKAIRSYCEAFQKKHPGLQLDLDLEEDVQPIPEQTGLVLFRIFQESLNNIYRHANASQVKVRLQVIPEQVILQVEDDGIGFQMPEDWLDLAHQGHLGLIGMRERAEAAGGSLVLRSAPGEGTWIDAQVPLSAGETSRDNP